MRLLPVYSVYGVIVDRSREQMSPTDAHSSARAKPKSVEEARMVSAHTGNEQCALELEKDQLGPLERILSRRQQIQIHVLVWCMVFVLGFSKSIFGVLTPYVTSSFEKHALTATISVLANIASGVVVLPYARLIEVWGRPESFSLMGVLTTLGSVMMACCQNVETFCAAQVFYYVGYYGIQFSLVILIADSAPVRNRALLFGIVWYPSLCSIWAYGPAADSILKSIGFRWGFGVWSIAIPIFCSPLIFLMFCYYGEARNAGHITRQQTCRPWPASIIYWIKEFDVFGLLILATGLSFLLLALSIYSYQTEGWKSPLILSFIIIGPFLLIAFGLYERLIAPTTFIPARLLKDRTVVWTNVMAATLYTSEFICSAYVYSMLIVVFDQGVIEATYINNIYSIGSSFATLVFGLAIRYYGRVKWYTVFLAIPLFILGQGLMIAFSPFVHTDREYTTALLAVESVVVYAGKSAGAAIATAIWTNLFKTRLETHLPPTEIPSIDDIYGSLDVQSSYATGSEARLAINHAYLDTQRVIFIVSTAMLSATWISVLFWKDMDVGRGRRAGT
ncbi:hypothetical protein Q7P37_003636 [Cladosporium fusiforme]